MPLTFREWLTTVLLAASCGAIVVHIRETWPGLL
jgi:hypothetical protein